MKPLKSLNNVEASALVYVMNTNHNVTEAQFDEDHEPIGPELREALMPFFMELRPDDGRLILTEDGMEIALTKKYGRR